MTSSTVSRREKLLTSSTMSSGKSFLHSTNGGMQSLSSTSGLKKFLTCSTMSRGERSLSSSTMNRRERFLISSTMSRGEEFLINSTMSMGKKFLTPKLRLYLSNTITSRGVVGHERLATTEKHMTRLHQQENMMTRLQLQKQPQLMSLQQQYTKTLEQKKRSNFNLQRINLSLNLMTMEHTAHPVKRKQDLVAEAEVRARQHTARES